MAYFKNFILQNFAFYNFCWRLGFQPLEKDLTTLQLLRILHGMIIIAKFLTNKDHSQGYLQKICIFQNFALYNFSQNLVFQFLQEDLATLQLLSIPDIIITIPKLDKKRAVRAIFKKNCNLRNLACYNFSGSLGFQPLQEDQVNVQLLKIPYGIVTVTKILRKTAVRTFVFCKMSDFTTFLRILTSSPQKRIGQLCSYLKYHMSHCNKKFLKKYCSYGYIQENLYFLKFCILRFLLEFYFSALRRLRSFIPCCNITQNHYSTNFS